jgi:hypothetical protein
MSSGVVVVVSLLVCVICSLVVGIDDIYIYI